MTAYPVTPLVEITYKEWKESLQSNYLVQSVYESLYKGSSYTPSTAITTVVGDGLANDMFYSEYLYEKKYTQVTHATEWQQLYADIVAADKANQKVISGCAHGGATIQRW